MSLGIIKNDDDYLIEREERNMDLDDEELQATREMNKTEKIKVVKKCYWCKENLYEKDIEKLGNARGYGYYIICPNCKNENIIREIDLTREI